MLSGGWGKTGLTQAKMVGHKTRQHMKLSMGIALFKSCLFCSYLNDAYFNQEQVLKETVTERMSTATPGCVLHPPTYSWLLP